MKTIIKLFKLIPVLLILLTSCEEIEVYDESIIINNELESEEITSTQDLSVTYVSLQSNTLRLSVNRTSNINQDTILELGLVYSNNENPILSDNKISANTINIANVIDIDNLFYGQSYFFKAYAITDLGVLYSLNQIEIYIPESGPVMTSQNSFSNLNGIESLIYPYGSNTQGPWIVTTSDCIEPPCITTGQSYGGYVVFNSDNPSDGYFEFWIKTFDPGYPNRIPKIKLNGDETTDIDIVDGNTTTGSSSFIKLRVNNVYAGNITITIDFEEFSNRIITYTIDEFKFYTNQ